ncbi:MAG TPA: hypothetical protein VGG28_12550 [Kofleriaceae bacterium]
MRHAWLLSLTACQLWQGPIGFPDAGSKTPAHVPIDLVWEARLEIYSGGSPAPMNVTEAQAWCDPTCSAVVVQPTVTNDSPHLAVAATRPGPVHVHVAYVQPNTREHLGADLQFVFEPAEQLHALAIGDPLPSQPFTFAYGATELRCEHEDDRARYLCFAREAEHFPSCSQTARCSIMPSGILVGGYTLELDAGSGAVVGATLYSGDYDRPTILQRMP